MILALLPNVSCWPILVALLSIVYLPFRTPPQTSSHARLSSAALSHPLANTLPCPHNPNQGDLLVGKAADTEFVDAVRQCVQSQDPTLEVDTVRAYHFGPKFLVEVELLMPPDTPLMKSHDTGIAVQHRIESLDDCERCFVHIDYQHRDFDDHDPEVPVQHKLLSPAASICNPLCPPLQP